MNDIVSVIILTYNRPNLLDELLDALHHQSNTQEFGIYITDDGTKPSEALRPPMRHEEFCWPLVKAYHWRADEGYHRVACFNDMFDFVPGNKVILMDDDCIPLSTMFVAQHALNLDNYDFSPGNILHTGHGTGYCGWMSTGNLGIKRSSMQQIRQSGVFHSEYDGYYGHEDKDLEQSIEYYGFKKCPFDVNSISTVVVHKGEFYADSDRSEAVIGRNTKLFNKRWPDG